MRLPRASLFAALILASCASGRVSPTVVDTSSGEPSRPRVFELAAGQHFTCALATDGDVRCWGVLPHRDPRTGAHVSSLPSHVRGLGRATSIAAGVDEACAIDAARDVWCWGSSIADPDDSLWGPAVRVPALSGAVELALSGGLVCARTTSGEGRCVELESTRDRKPSATIADSGVLEIVGSYGAIYARLADGSVVVLHGRKGSHLHLRHTLPVDDAQSLVRSGEKVCALLWDGTPRCFVNYGGLVDSAQVAPLVLENAALISRCARFFDGNIHCRKDPKPEPKRGVDNASQIVSSEDHVCALEAGGSVACWGSVDALGNVGIQRRPREVTFAHGATSLGVDGALTCASVDARSVRCWGERPNHARPAQLVEPLAGALGIAPDDQFDCARDAVGVVTCLDVRARTRFDLRLDDAALTARQILWTGPAALVAVLDDGGMARARYGTSNLGDAFTTERVADVRDVAQLAFARVPASEKFDGDRPQDSGWGTWYARMRDGTVAFERCSRFPNASCRPTSALSFHLVPGLTDVVDLAAGQERACAVLASGGVVCWATRADGEGRTASVEGVAGATRVVVGGAHACAIVDEGRVACWGNDDRGQLGDGRLDFRDRAEIVPGIRGVVDLALGGAHTCALDSSHVVRCWGDTRFGQIRDTGELRFATDPIRIPGLPN